MPVTESVKKALRSSQRKAEFNRPVKSKAQSSVIKMRKEPNKDNLAKAFSALDIAAKRHVFHNGKVSRLKARLSKLIVENKSEKKDLPKEN